MEHDSVENKPPAYIRASETAKAHGLASVPTKLPGHNVKSDIKTKLKSDKKIHWDKDLNIRFHITTGNEIYDYSQPVIDHQNLNDKTSMIYLMLTSLALDTI